MRWAIGPSRPLIRAVTAPLNGIATPADPTYPRPPGWRRPPRPRVTCYAAHSHTKLPTQTPPTPKKSPKWFKNDISLGKHRAETPMGVANRPRHISQMASKQYSTAYS